VGRRGYNEYVTINGEWYDGFLVNNSFALIAGYDEKYGDVKIYEIALAYNPDHPQFDFPADDNIDSVPATTNDETGFRIIGKDFARNRYDGSTANWQFCKHYDTTLGHCVIMTNGYDKPQIYTTDSASASYRELIEMPFTDDDVRAIFVASMKGSVYLSNCLVNGNPAATPLSADLTVWSANNNGAKFESAKRSQRRPESDSPISGLIRHKNNLYLGKYDEGQGGELWQIQAYSNFTNLSTINGFYSPYGQIASDYLYFNSLGKVWVAEDMTNPLSGSIDDMFSASASTQWNTIRGIEDRVNRQLIFSNGKRLWLWDKNFQTWMLQEYNDDIKVLFSFPASQRFLYQWEGTLSEHTTILAEEDLMTDIMFVLGKDKLCRSSSNYTDDGSDITLEYDTPWDDGGDCDIEKSFRRFTIHGEGGPFEVWGDFCDTPRLPVMSKLGTITLNSKGFGYCSVNRRARFGTARIKSTYNTKQTIVKCGFECDPEKNVT
jgi:hypothetical protein